MKISMATRNKIIENTKNRYKIQRKADAASFLMSARLQSASHVISSPVYYVEHPKPKSTKKSVPLTPKPLKSRGRKARYGRPHQGALLLVWHMLGCIASKRLKAALPARLAALERFNHPLMDSATAQDLL